MTNIATRTLIVGMEIHVELATNSKMFCGCKNDPFHAPAPNTYVCPVCMGFPGAIPVANKKAVDWTIKLGLALGCTIAHESKFDRKHYFYPDLPKGYQISQYDQPLCTNGLIHTEFGDVRITRVHLEEDTAKMIHKTVNGKKVSLIDFNRSSVPLVEIVSEPDIHSPEQAKAYAKALRDIVRTLGISEANMEQGSMRLEANISMADNPAVLPNYKVEVKNINSFRFVDHAIAYEMKRHTELLNAGETPKQETLGWNEEKRQTVSQRTKEDAEDYRYFPDPDLPPMTFTDDAIEALRRELPELPQQKAARYVQMGMKEEYARLVSDPDFPLDMEKLLQCTQTSGLKINDVIGAIVNSRIKTEEKTEQMIVDEVKASLSFAEVDDTAIENAVQLVLTTNESAVVSYKAGKTNVIGFLMGQVMKELKTKVDPKKVQEIMKKALE